MRREGRRVDKRGGGGERGRYGEGGRRNDMEKGGGESR